MAKGDKRLTAIQHSKEQQRKQLAALESQREAMRAAVRARMESIKEEMKKSVVSKLERDNKTVSGLLRSLCSQRKSKSG